MATFIFSTCFSGRAILVTIATIKVELISDFYTSAIVRYKTNKKELVKSNLYILVSKRAKIHVAPKCTQLFIIYLYGEKHEVRRPQEHKESGRRGKHLEDLELPFGYPLSQLAFVVALLARIKRLLSRSCLESSGVIPDNERYPTVTEDQAE